MFDAANINLKDQDSFLIKGSESQTVTQAA